MHIFTELIQQPNFVSPDVSCDLLCVVPGLRQRKANHFTNARNKWWFSLVSLIFVLFSPEPVDKYGENCSGEIGGLAGSRLTLAIIATMLAVRRHSALSRSTAISVRTP